jgi:16S rRNA (cytosine967-C5)-methyltransferase
LAKVNVRNSAIKVLLNILNKGVSCSRALPEQAELLAVNERALLQELCFGVLRWHERLGVLEAALTEKPLRAKDRDISLLIRLGLYQLEQMNIPEHAVVQETVKVAILRKKPWARGLVNAVLRRFLREKDVLLATIDKDERALYSHPEWMLNLLKADWPDHWQDICTAANQRPPMTLRVNVQKISRQAYIEALDAQEMPATAHPYAHSAVVLERPVAVTQLPHFQQGYVSVQDAGAQLATQLLQPMPGERVLDTCAAPGGKTCHMLEYAENLQLISLDSDKARCERIDENLHRLGLNAEVICADAAVPESWWDGQMFDAMLLDVPCSALGVIRRHPDIKALRQAADLEGLAEQQQRILQSAWALLKPGGRMLFATCSVATIENNQQVAQFVNTQADAQRIIIEADWGVAQSHGRQILTGQSAMDGFFYALLRKAL